MTDTVGTEEVPESEPLDIVLVDDDEDIREILSFSLQNEGYGVTAFENGQECWDVLSTESPPDLVILDIMMPGMNGFEVLRKIRQDARLSEVPVIVLSSCDREEDIVKGFESGADYYMRKPFSPQELVARIQRVK